MAIGLSPESFWGMTPWEFAFALDGYRRVHAPQSDDSAAALTDEQWAIAEKMADEDD